MAAGNFWCSGTWGSSASVNTDGQSSTQMDVGDWIIFYAGALTDDLPQTWLENEQTTVYEVDDGLGNFGGALVLYVQATGSTWGKIDWHNADGTKYNTNDIHAGVVNQNIFDHTVQMYPGTSIHVKRSS